MPAQPARAKIRQQRAWIAAVLWMALCLLFPARAGAVEFEPSDESSLQFHGLVSQGFLKSTSNNYIGFSHRGTFDFTEGALNATMSLGETLRVGLQLFVAKLGPQGNYNANYDWFYLDWHRWDWFGIRAGRIKLPFGLYNEQSDYDPDRLTVLLPQSIYPIVNREFLLAATGFAVYGYLELHKAGALSYNFVLGESFQNFSTTLPPGSTTDVPYTYCGRLLWEPPVRGLRAGASVLGTKLNFTLPSGQQAVTGNLPAVLWVASIEYQKGGLLLATEYSHWNTTLTSSPPTAFPNGTTVSERFYVSGQYYLTDSVGLGLYTSVLYPDISQRGDGPQNYAYDTAASVRYDITTHWLLKLELHYVHGTANLTSSLNNDLPLSELTPNWGLLTGKVTAYF